MVAFYNVENLFDTINDPTINDEEFTPAGENQWNAERYQNKLDNLAKVISSMNAGKGPDILGLCEIENFKVLKDLINTKALKPMHYGIVHLNSKDNRGIDVAMLYKEDALPALSFSMVPVQLPDSVPPTRDVMLVETEINEKPLSFLICHFPSRSEGKEKSEYKRAIAALTVIRTLDSLKAVSEFGENPNKPNIIVMGDFNDEPTDASMSGITNGCNPGMLNENCDMINLMQPLKEKGLGSYKYKEEWNMLDQILVNANLYSGKNGFKVVPNSAAIYAEDWMKQTEPKYLGSPMRTFGGRKYLGGYSDHFPVFVIIDLK